MGGNLSSPITGSSVDSEEARVPEVQDEDRSSITSKLPVELTSKYEVLEKIGSGSFGSVYKVRRVESRVLYAAKYCETKDNTAMEVASLISDHTHSSLPPSQSAAPPLLAGS